MPLAAQFWPQLGGMSRERSDRHPCCSCRCLIQLLLRESSTKVLLKVHINCTKNIFCVCVEEDSIFVGGEIVLWVNSVSAAVHKTSSLTHPHFVSVGTSRRLAHSWTPSFLFWALSHGAFPVVPAVPGPGNPQAWGGFGATRSTEFSPKSQLPVQLRWQWKARENKDLYYKSKIGI